MARDSQPPPPQVIADLQERLDALQAEFDDYRAAADTRVQSAVDAAVCPLQDQLQSVSGELGKSHSENASLIAVLRERDEEIAYLQGQLEATVSELADAKFGGMMHSGAVHDSTMPSAVSNASVPSGLVRDVKQRLHALEDRLSHCNITCASK